MATTADPLGRSRISANVPFGTHFMLPLVPEFLATNPAVTLDITLTDEDVAQALSKPINDVGVSAHPKCCQGLVVPEASA